MKINLLCLQTSFLANFPCSCQPVLMPRPKPKQLHFEYLLNNTWVLMEGFFFHLGHYHVKDHRKNCLDNDNIVLIYKPKLLWAHINLAIIFVRHLLPCLSAHMKHFMNTCTNPVEKTLERKRIELYRVASFIAMKLFPTWVWFCYKLFYKNILLIGSTF